MKRNQIKDVPKGAWDTHHHIFDSKRFPFANGRHFTPSEATLEQLQEFEKSIGVDHVCIAHGLSYGPDCTSLLYFLEQFKGKARGIGVIDESTVTNEVLDRYHAAGVRSVRLNFFKHQAMDDLEKQVALIESTATRLTAWGDRGWSIQIQQPHVQFWPRLRQVAARLSVPLVVDHMGLLRGQSMRSEGEEDVTTTQDFRELLGALEDGNVWMKISAPYRCSYQDYAYADLEGLVHALVKANSSRVLWGSDWPHTQRHGDRIGKDPSDREPFLKIDDAVWIRSLSTWMSDSEWYAMWVDNPRTLYNYKESD